MELRFEDEEDEEELGQKLNSRTQEDSPEATAHSNGPSLTNEAAWDTGLCVCACVFECVFVRFLDRYLQRLKRKKKS